MSGLISKVYSVITSAGAGFQKAHRAASALADYENRFARLEADLIQIKLMLAGVMALVAILVIKAFFN